MYSWLFSLRFTYIRMKAILTSFLIFKFYSSNICSYLISVCVYVYVNCMHVCCAVLWDFSSDTIIHKNNLTRCLISCCNTFAVLNYLRKNISRACCLSNRTLVFEATTFYMGRWGWRLWGNSCFMNESLDWMW